MSDLLFVVAWGLVSITVMGLWIGAAWVARRTLRRIDDHADRLAARAKRRRDEAVLRQPAAPTARMVDTTDEDEGPHAA